MSSNQKVVLKTSHSIHAFTIAAAFALAVAANANARQLFYVLDRTSGPAYANMVKCYDLQGNFQYEILSTDPPGTNAYSAMATDGNTIWLAGEELHHIRSFAARPGAPGGATIPLQTTETPTHGGCTGLAVSGGSLWLSRALTWGTPTGRIEVYSTAGAYVQGIPADIPGWYPGSLQLSGGTLLIKDLLHDDKIYSIDTGSVWQPYGPLTLIGAPLSGRAICANGTDIWVLGYSGAWYAFAFDYSGNRQPANDALLPGLSQPLDMYLADGPDEAVISIDPMSLNFGPVPAEKSKTLSLQITNVGNIALTVNSIQLSDSDNYQLSPVSLPLSIPPSSSTNIDVTFTPQNAGSLDTELLIGSTDAYHPTLTVNVAGEGVTSLWYVDTDAAPGGDGLSWQTAFQNIPDALAEPLVLDGAEIRVRSGYHQGPILIDKAVSLIGAFDDEGNRDLDNTDRPYIDGNGSSLCMHITADGAQIDGFAFENGNNVYTYPTSMGRGGGIYVEADNVTIANCWVGFNYASQGGGGIYIEGSGSTISDSMIEGNDTPRQAGGLCIDGSDTTIARTEIVDNAASQSGGGIYVQGNLITINDCAIHSNQSGYNGAGIYAGQVTMTNCLITDNRTTFAYQQGGGIYCTSLDAVNCTIANNFLKGDSNYRGAGVHCYNPYPQDHCILTNCIFWGNTNDNGDLDSMQIYAYDPVVTYSNVHDTAYGGSTGQGDANHNIRQEPLFVNPDALDWWQRDYYLAPESPCIDTGTGTGAPATDIDGTARPWGLAHDMGAYEYFYEYPGPWHVDSTVNTSGDGTTWPQAVQSVTEVFDRLSHIQDVEIWVRAGTYEAPAIEIDRPAKIYGGFNGTETQLDQRDYRNNPTIFDGNYEKGGPAITADATLDGLTFTRCSEDWGGALYIEWCSPAITNCTFTCNRAEEFGGAIFIDGSAPTVTQCLFANNFSQDTGGAIDMTDSAPLITNSIFAGNVALNIAGALSVYHSEALVDNCTFVANILVETDYSAAVDAYETGLVLTNSIFRDNLTVLQPDQPDLTSIDTDLLVNYCNLQQDGFAGQYGNISADPLFADPGYWNDNGTPDFPEDDFFVLGDYHLQSTAGRWDPLTASWTTDARTSPCIDTGNPGIAPTEETLPNGDRINTGAYGRTTHTSRTPPGWSLLSDLNNDGAVDLSDIASQDDTWLIDCNQCPADLNRDGTVNLADFAVLAQQWQDTTAWH